MVKPVALLLLLAVAASQVDLSLSVTITGSGEADIYECPITYYGHKYTRVHVAFTPNLKICFKNRPRDPEQNCLLFEDGGIGSRLDVEIQIETNNIDNEALKDINSTSECNVNLESYTGEEYYLDFYFYNFDPQAAVKMEAYDGFNALNILNITAKVLDETVDSWFMSRQLTTVYRDISGMPDPKNCNVTISHSTAFFGPFHVCGPLEFCNGNNTCFPLLPVCTVTGSTVIDFFSRVHSVPDRCVYSLMRSQGSSDFELLAGFKERRRQDVMFLDHLILWLKEPGVTFYLEQGGRVRVDDEILTLNATAQVVHGVELWKDETGVTAKIPFTNMTVFFDGYTAQVSGYNETVEGLCGNLIDPNQNKTQSIEKSYVYSADGCDIQHNGTDVGTFNCTGATEHCNLLRQAPFTDCHNYTDPEPYITACTNTLCNYPVVDDLRCQLLEAYAKTCSLRRVIPLEDWRTTSSCSASPQAFCQAKYCSEHEFCGEELGDTRCLCRAIFASVYRENDTLGEPAVCLQNSGSITLIGCLLEDKDVDYSTLHLNDQNCTGNMDSQTHMLTFNFSSRDTCGTKVTKSNSQVIFQNTITTGNSSMNGIITHQNQFVIDFSCYYTEPEVETVGFRIKDSSVVQQIESGFWNYSLMMNAYTNSNRMNPVDLNTEIELNHKIWVELKTEGLDDSMVVLVTDSCWATNLPSPDDTLKHYLITGGCPDDQTVMLEGNGMGMSNFFSFNLFEFSRRNNEVYLHCKLELCPKQGNSCAPTCSGGGLRKRRSYRHKQGHPALITMAWSK